MTEPNAAALRAPRTSLPKTIVIPIAILLTLVFIVLGFPWDSLARRVAWEISAASGSRVSIERLAPALTARGPVLRASDVVIEHPAVDRVRLDALEIAPRLSTGWFLGEPRLRVWADSQLGLVDGVLELGSTPSFVGRVSQVELANLPLRIEASGIGLSGRLDADADVALDPTGTLHGRVEFVSPGLVLESNRLPMAIPFSRASGVILILENGATQVEAVSFEGELVEGLLSGEIGLVHRSQSPPVDLEAEIRIVDPTLRRLAPSADLPISTNGEIAVRVRGTLDAPEIEPLPGRNARDARGRTRPNRARP